MHMYNTHPKKILCTNKRGFSFVETLVVVAITVLVSGALLGGIASFYRFDGYVIAQAYQVSYARQGVEQMVRDLREMTYADDGTFPLVTMGTTSISFYSDIDRDDSVELVRYSLSSTTLYKYIYAASGSPPVYSTTTPESTSTLSEYVQNKLLGTSIFTYYDENGATSTASSTLTDIRYVKVNIVINIDPLRDPGQYMLETSASLRNLKVYE